MSSFDVSADVVNYPILNPGEDATNEVFVDAGACCHGCLRVT
jgi:hypothetical protein